MLDDVSGDGADDDGLALPQVDGVRRDLRAVVAGGIPANTQAGGRRVKWRPPGAAVLVLLVLVRVRRCLVPLQVGLLQSVNVADGRGHGAWRLAQHGFTERPHASHIYRLCSGPETRIGNMSQRREAVTTFNHKVAV